MASLYLVDAHNTVLNNSKINDTLSVPAGLSYTGTRSTRGSFVVQVPYEVPLEGTPTDLTDIMTKKYQGILSLYPGYSNILYDEQTDATGWAFPPGVGTPICTVGERQSTSVSTGGTLDSVVTVLGTTPAQCVLRWESYQYIYTDDPSLVVDRQYNEQDGTQFAVSVSFNNGANFNAVTSGVVFSIPLAHQGNQFKIRFQRNAGVFKLGLAAWSLIY